MSGTRARAREGTPRTESGRTHDDCLRLDEEDGEAEVPGNVVRRRRFVASYVEVTREGRPSSGATGPSDAKVRLGRTKAAEAAAPSRLDAAQQVSALDCCVAR